MDAKVMEAGALQQDQLSPLAERGTASSDHASARTLRDTPALSSKEAKYSNATDGRKGEPAEVLDWELSPAHPRNWPNSKRWKNALIISITGFLSTTGSSIFVPAAPIIMKEFNIGSREVVTLTTALYVLGLGCGPFVFAPTAELYGRQMAYAISMLGQSSDGLTRRQSG